MSSLVLAMDIVSSLLHIWQRDEFLEYNQYHYLEYGKMELYIKHFLHVKLIWIKKNLYCTKELVLKKHFEMQILALLLTPKYA